MTDWRKKVWYESKGIIPPEDVISDYTMREDWAYTKNGASWFAVIDRFDLKVMMRSQEFDFQICIITYERIE